jgi:hypothetical protein
MTEIPVVAAPEKMIPGVRVSVQLYVIGEQTLEPNIFNVTYVIKEDGKGLTVEAINKCASIMKEIAATKMNQPVVLMTDAQIADYDRILEAQQEALERRAEKGYSDA